MASMILTEFIEELDQARTIENIHSSCLNFCQHLGFDHFIYGSVIRGACDKSHLFVINGYPEEWHERYFSEGYLAIDPAVAHCQTRVSPFYWESIEPLAKRSNTIQKMMTEARDFGLKSGGSFPVHGAQGESAMLSLASEKDSASTRSRILEATPYVQLFAGHLFEAVRRVRMTREIGPDNVQIIECEKEYLLT